jgi:hypothetical protein
MEVAEREQGFFLEFNALVVMTVANWGEGMGQLAYSWEEVLR